MNLQKKLERYLRVNLLGPGPRLMKKEFTWPRSHKGWETLVYSLCALQRSENRAVVCFALQIRMFYTFFNPIQFGVCMLCLNEWNWYVIWSEKFDNICFVCVFFWVIPRRLNFICRRFGTLCLVHLHRRIGVEWLSSSQIFFPMNTPTFLKHSHPTPTCLWRWNRVFRNVGI